MWAKVPGLHRRVVRLGLDELAGQEEFFTQFLMPLLSQVGRRNDEDSTLSFRPTLREHEPGLDRLAESNLVGKQGTLGEGRVEGEQRRINLVRIQVHLRARDGASQLVVAV
jgi:hypothetical protein